MSVSLKVEGISKWYEKNKALQQVDLEIKKGEFICLLGPSGCGKSTLLRLIAGLDTPSEGKIYIDEKEATNLPPSKRNFGIVFQSYALFPNLTAFENVAYGLRNKKMTESNIESRVNSLFEMIHLSDAKSRYPMQLSGGEQQRVALARALALYPDFLLLDEPLSALDAKVRIALRKEICKIQKELGLTTIMVTHDQDEALTMADRIIVMNKAKVIQIGTPQAVYAKPRNAFVADFVGAINWIDASLPKWASLRKKERMAIRPENIEIRKVRDGESLDARVEAIEFRGAYDRVSVCLDYYDDESQFIVDVPEHMNQKLQLSVGDKIFIHMKPEYILHLDQG